MDTITPNREDMVSVAEAMDITGLSRAGLYRKRTLKELDGYKIGKGLYFLRTQIVAITQPRPSPAKARETR